MSTYIFSLEIVPHGYSEATLGPNIHQVESCCLMRAGVSLVTPYVSQFNKLLKAHRALHGGFDLGDHWVPAGILSARLYCRYVETVDRANTYTPQRAYIAFFEGESRLRMIDKSVIDHSCSSCVINMQLSSRHLPYRWGRDDFGLIPYREAVIWAAGKELT